MGFLRQGPSVNFAQKVTSFTLQCNAKDVAKFGEQIYVKQVCVAPKFVPKCIINLNKQSIMAIRPPTL